ncbi:MAG: class 3 adenylate cyclase [Verrucomicrobiales bacterium]|jgi:class 3 adenylate cyclase
MEVVIDDATRERISERFVTEEIPSLNLKGFSETIRARNLIRST